MGRAGKLALTSSVTRTSNSPPSRSGRCSQYNCAGYYGGTCGVSDPKWKHKIRVTWPTPLTTGCVRGWRISVGSATTRSPNPLLNSPGSQRSAVGGDRRVNYIDLGAAYTFAGKYTMRVGVNNVIDKDPPVIFTSELPTVFGNGNTIPQDLRHAGPVYVRQPDPGSLTGRVRRSAKGGLRPAFFLASWPPECSG